MALVFHGGYHPRKMKHVISVVFQDHVMYIRTSFRGANTSKSGKKGVFLIAQNYEKAYKTHIKGLCSWL